MADHLTVGRNVCLDCYESVTRQRQASDPMMMPFRSAIPGGIDDVYVPPVVRLDDRRERCRGSLRAGDPEHPDNRARQADRSAEAGRAGREPGCCRSGRVAGCRERQPGCLAGGCCLPGRFAGSLACCRPAGRPGRRRREAERPGRQGQAPAQVGAAGPVRGVLRGAGEGALHRREPGRHDRAGRAGHRLRAAGRERAGRLRDRLGRELPGVPRQGRADRQRSRRSTSPAACCWSRRRRRTSRRPRT